MVEQQKYEERQRMEKEIQEKNRLSQIKNKNKDEESKSYRSRLICVCDTVLNSADASLWKGFVVV